MRSPITIILDPEQSEIIAEAGSVFIVAHRAMRTEDRTVNGRWILSLISSSIDQVNAACRVASGQSTERKPRTSNP